MEIAKLFKATRNKANKSKSAKKKTILFVEQNQDGTVGGSYYSLLYMVRALDKKKYDALVMFYDEHDIIDKFAMNGVTPITYKKPTSKHITPPHWLLQIPYVFARKLYNFIRVSCFPVFPFVFFIIRNNVDLVHLNNSADTGWQWLLVSKLLGRKCITHQRGFVRFSKLAKRRAKFFDKIICISRAIKKNLQNNNISNTQVIYNAIDVDEFRSRLNRDRRSIREELGINYSAPLIGVIANFQEWKGHLIVINAMDILRQRHDDVICLFIGAVSAVKQDREYFIRVTKEIQDKGLEKNVIMTGYRQDIPDLINSLDILVHSSIEPEPFGRVIIEGMCFKKPVIATDIGGPREIIKNGVSGFLISPGNPGILSETVELFLQDPDLGQKMGNEGFNRILAKFNIETFSFKINMFYEELMKDEK